jgi:hypothetical protein
MKGEYDACFSMIIELENMSMPTFVLEEVPACADWDTSARQADDINVGAISLAPAGADRGYNASHSTWQEKLFISLCRV